MGRKEISETGCWVNIRSHQTDKGLKEFLIEKFGGSDKKFYDFGCGNAQYAHGLVATGVDIECYDGSPLTPELSQGLGKILDLTSDFEFTPRDWTICLEVGEHVPEQYEDKLIENIVKHTTEGIILSWAVPGQRGTGHVNCKSNDYVRGRMADNNFYTDKELEEGLRNSIRRHEYFKWTLMAFRRSG